MIALFRYHSTVMGSQFSIRAGDAAELADQIFFRDGLKMLLDQGYHSRSKRVKAQFEPAEKIYQAQCDGRITLEMIQGFDFTTDLGGFSCLASATNCEELDHLCQVVLDLTESRRKVNAAVETNVSAVLSLIEQAKSGETPELTQRINEIHHIL